MRLAGLSIALLIALFAGACGEQATDETADSTLVVEDTVEVVEVVDTVAVEVVEVVDTTVVVDTAAVVVDSAAVVVDSAAVI